MTKKQNKVKLLDILKEVVKMEVQNMENIFYMMNLKVKVIEFKLEKIWEKD